MMDDEASVRRQYAHEGNLQARRSVWQPGDDGRDPTAVALGMLHTFGEVTSAAARNAHAPGRKSWVLEVGCGTGDFAERLAALPDLTVTAVDTSERFVELTADRGVDARVADIQDLPFHDRTFDAVAAMWMLYHVPDLDRGLAEVRRVLRPGGVFLAMTNGDEHVADLRREAGGEPVVTGFSSENGEASLRRHFGEVRREDFRTRAVFPDHARAVAYLQSSQEDVDWQLPPFEGSKEYAGHVTMFLCR